MKRLLTWLNLLAVLALAALSIVQWRINRQLNLEASRLEQIRIDQSTKIAEQEKAIQGYLFDLDDFRHRLSDTESALKETETKLAAATRQIDHLTAETNQLTAEKATNHGQTLDRWMAAGQGAATTSSKRPA